MTGFIVLCIIYLHAALILLIKLCFNNFIKIITKKKHFNPEYYIEDLSDFYSEETKIFLKIFLKKIFDYLLEFLLFLIKTLFDFFINNFCFIKKFPFFKSFIVNNTHLTYDFFIFFLKKYIYTINHKRIAINYIYFILFSCISGVWLATVIRMELSISGSHFFKGDSLKYFQVITGHGLIMVFFVVTPLLFGFFANFFIPYHIGSKDVAFPRFNSIGFWVLFCGLIVLVRPCALKRQLYKYYDSNDMYHNLSLRYKIFRNFRHFIKANTTYPEIEKDEVRFFKIILNKLNSNITESLWYLFFNKFSNEKVKTTFAVHTKNVTLTMSGWTFITPFSSVKKYTGFGAQDIAVIAVIFAGISTTISFVNLLITRRTLSMPGIRNRKILLPFLTINLLLTMRMLTMIIPVLGAAMIMLELDRHWGFSFFDYSYGGDPILFQHLFWFFGHPEVYVVIIPSFGMISMLIPFYSYRRIAAKSHLLWATYIMAYMGFLVWGHHMYMVGLDHKSRSLYSTITVMISLPAVVKIVNWTLSILNGSIKIDTPFMFAFSFFFYFLCGGLTGMWLSHVGLNTYVHDTFYIVAHFHFMFSATTFSAAFSCFYYYFWQIFNIRYSRTLSFLHSVYWFCGQWLTFLPIFYIGYNGLPRRYHDYPIMFECWNSMASSGHTMTGVSMFLFFFCMCDAFVLKSSCVVQNYYIPRWHKRINYYVYKITHIQAHKKLINIKYIELEDDALV